MTQVRIATVFVQSSHAYEIHVSGEATVGAVARYLSQQEAYVDANTLELARPVAASQRLQDIDLQAGDRLVIALQAPRPAEVPPPLSPGDKVLKFSLGDFEISSRGKKSLLVGKPDDSRQMAPDIDLRNFIAPKMLDYVSRVCLRLDFDEDKRVWRAARVGVTRLMIDEFELTDEPIVLEGERWLRFYRGADDPSLPTTRPIGAIRVRVEEAQSAGDLAQLAPGSYRLCLQVGLEKETQTLNASEHLPIGRLADSLARYNGIVLGPEHRLYLMRLLSPEARLSALNLTPAQFLYTTRLTHYAENLLILRDIHDKKRVYAIQGGLDGSEKLVGRRAEAMIPDANLDIDLYDAFLSNDTTGRTLNLIPRHLAWIQYRPAENGWWMRLDERTTVPVFANNARLNARTPMQLTSGDVLTFGSSIDNYYVRFEVEITSRAD